MKQKCFNFLLKFFTTETRRHGEIPPKAEVITSVPPCLRGEKKQSTAASRVHRILSQRASHFRTHQSHPTKGIKSLLSACLFLLLAATAPAQKSDLPCDVGNCPCLEAKADKALSARPPDFQTAIEKYQALALCDPAKRAYADKQILAVFEEIQNLQKQASQNAAKAKAKEKEAIAQKQRAEAVLDKIYFYCDTLGLAYDQRNGKYGYIDKYLNTKIDFKYDEAFSFEESGYARVRRKDNSDRDSYFLIDVLGNEYKLATALNQLDSTITALDLRTISIDSIKPEVFHNNKQLQVILADKFVPGLDLQVLTKLKTFYQSGFSLKLYFDNDQPKGVNPASTTTNLLYAQTYFAYYNRKGQYLKEFSSGLVGDERAKARASMDEFFEHDVRGEWSRFRAFREYLTEELRNGNCVKVTIRGIVTPVGNQQYNSKLAARRVDCVTNHLFYFEGETDIADFVHQGRFVVQSEISRSAKHGYNFARNESGRTIFDLVFVRERRVEITGMEIFRCQK